MPVPVYTGILPCTHAYSYMYTQTHKYLYFLNHVYMVISHTPLPFTFKYVLVSLISYMIFLPSIFQQHENEKSFNDCFHRQVLSIPPASVKLYFCLAGGSGPDGGAGPAVGGRC